MKLAIRNGQKSSRFIYRSVQNDCVVYDKSYYHCIQVSGELSMLKLTFARVSDPSLPAMTSESYLGGKRQGVAFLHESLQFPHKCVSQVSFYWECSNNSNKRLWIWVHLDTFDYVLELLKEELGKSALQMGLSSSTFG